MLVGLSAFLDSGFRRQPAPRAEPEQRQQMQAHHRGKGDAK
jgi:hypothetical protein